MFGGEDWDVPVKLKFPFSGMNRLIGGCAGFMLPPHERIAGSPKQKSINTSFFMTHLVIRARYPKV
jgi:hypothetical protein